MNKAYQGISARLNTQDYEALQYLARVSRYTQSGVLRVLINQAASLPVDEAKKLIRSEEDIPPRGPIRRKKLKPDQLGAYLKGFNVGVEEFAGAIGVCTNTILRWLDGSRNPNLVNSKKIHRYLCGLLRKDNCVLDDSWTRFRLELAPKRKNGEATH